MSRVTSQRRALLAARWPVYLAGALVLLYLLVFVRGLGWQWWGILSGTRPAPPAVSAGPRSAPAPANPAARGGPAPPAQPAPPGAAKVPLSPTDEPPPRDTTDKYGVTYDAQGVAVMGIDADPGGVYNVPPGRQLRIGGPAGQLYDVQPGGKLTSATRVREFPR